MKNKLILIAGGTASGKTLIADDVVASLSESNLSVTKINMDNYYKDITYFPNMKVSEVNWDSPESIQWEDLIKDIIKLMNNETVIRNIYDYETATYLDDVVEMKKADYFILEGLFALYNEQLNNKSTIRIYVHADSDTRVMRRLKRDKETRYKDFNENEFFMKWTNTLKPMHDKFIEPTKTNAHIVIQTNNNEKDHKKLEESVDLIVKLIK